jgi:ubiquitin-protein ligase E3 C
MAAVGCASDTMSSEALMFLRMFNQQEAQILLGGVNSPVDLDDLRKHTNYSGVYDDTEITITAFWNVRVLFPEILHRKSF